MLRYSVRKAILKAEEDRLAAMTPEEKAAEEANKQARMQRSLLYSAPRYCEPTDHLPFMQTISPRLLVDIRQTHRVREGKLIQGT